MHEIFIPWKETQTGFWWNETCAMVLNHFGLPGERYTSHPSHDSMIFKFFNEHDALMCKLLISDRL
jgi:hypothetical protein